MSIRNQILMSENEAAHFKEVARKEHMSFGAWIRKAMRQAADDKQRKTVAEKLRAIQTAFAYSFPTCDIETMNREIEEGCETGLP